MKSLLNGPTRICRSTGPYLVGCQCREGMPRIAHLQAAEAMVRFLSVEPLLEDIGTINLTGINWVIGGGESGFGARPMEK
jgi:protein gp37